MREEEIEPRETTKKTRGTKETQKQLKNPETLKFSKTSNPSQEVCHGAATRGHGSFASFVSRCSLVWRVFEDAQHRTRNVTR